MISIGKKETQWYLYLSLISAIGGKLTAIVRKLGIIMQGFQWRYPGIATFCPRSSRQWKITRAIVSKRKLGWCHLEFGVPSDYSNGDKWLDMPNVVPHLDLQMLPRYIVVFWKLEFWEFYQPKVGWFYEFFRHSNVEFKLFGDNGCHCFLEFQSEYFQINGAGLKLSYYV